MTREEKWRPNASDENDFIILPKSPVTLRMDHGQWTSMKAHPFDRELIIGHRFCVTQIYDFRHHRDSESRPKPLELEVCSCLLSRRV